MTLSSEIPATKTLGASPHRPLGAALRVVGVPAAPARYRLDQGTCVVGSAESCDLVVKDPLISRSHLELQLVAGGVQLRDLGSRNGTFYLGQRVERMVLGLGASVTIGSARLLLEPDLEELAQLSYDNDIYRGMVASSLPMRRLFAVLARLEGSTVAVHVTGESGVGKELVARALHEGSGVSGPLVVVNCGAVSRELIASELFGHRRGAFTGAVEQRRGAFESADGGTLFLDEIGELPLDVQPVLLRALETGEVRPVGGDRVESVRVRVVSATHRDLERDVREGRFREDLYYRLAVLKLQVPPLRERPEDVSLLARRFAQSLGVELPPHVLHELYGRRWPGNVRELRNVVQAFAVLKSLPAPPPADEGALGRSLTQFIDVSRPYAQLKEELLDRFQQAYLEALLPSVNGNQSAAARISGLDRTYLGRLVAKYGLSKP